MLATQEEPESPPKLGQQLEQQFRSEEVSFRSFRLETKKLSPTPSTRRNPTKQGSGNEGSKYRNPFRVASRLHCQNWRRITSDRWTLETIIGVQAGAAIPTVQATYPVGGSYCRVNLCRGREAGGQGSRMTSASGVQGFLLQNFSGTQVRRPTLPSNQSPPPESVHGVPTLQDRGSASSEGLLPAGDWLTHIDLKDAYFSFPIHPDYCSIKWPSY